MIGTRPLRVTVERKPTVAQAAPGKGLAGIGRRRLLLPASVGGRVDLQGYSLGSPRAKLPPPEEGHIHTPLFARAFLFVDATGNRVCLVATDTWSGSRYLLEKAAAETAALGIGVDRLLVTGTHTHTAPAGYTGNSFYDLLGSNPNGFSAAVADAWAETIAGAVRAAAADLREARVGVGVARVWGASSNRSDQPFQANPESASWNTHGFPGAGAPPWLGPDTRRHVDPRVTAIVVAEPDGAVRGAFAVFACHGTSLGNKHERLSGDWAALAAERAGTALGDVVVGIAGGASGDMSPQCLPADPLIPPQGRALQVRAGERVAAGIVDAVRAGLRHLREVRVDARWGEWAPTPGDPEDENALGRFDYGFPTLGGSEDGYSGLGNVSSACREGAIDPQNPNLAQRPKRSARDFLEGLNGGSVPLAPAPVHPTHVVELAGWRFATVPGEPTVVAAHRIEQALGATVIGYAGDYAGYFPTREEYALQHYEGSSSLYGRNALAHLIAHLRGVANEGATPQPGPIVFDTARALTLDFGPPTIPAGTTVTGGARADGVVLAWRRSVGAPLGADPTELKVRVAKADGTEATTRTAIVEVHRAPLPDVATQVTFLVRLADEALPEGPLRVTVPPFQGWPGWSATAG